MLVVDGKAGYGQSVGRQAMELAIGRAKEHGVCVMAVRRSFHLCRIGAWGEQCARAGLVSIHYVNVVGHPGLVAPWRGSDARYATNPYCITMPATGENPVTQLDMATSIVAHGKVRVAKNKGERMAPGMLIDSDGQPTPGPECDVRASDGRDPAGRRAQGLRHGADERADGGRALRRPRPAGRRRTMSRTRS